MILTEAEIIEQMERLEERIDSLITSCQDQQKPLSPHELLTRLEEFSGQLKALVTTVERQTPATPDTAAPTLQLSVSPRSRYDDA